MKEILVFKILTPGVHLATGPGQKILNRVETGQFFVARVASVIFGLDLGLENFP